MEEDKEFINKDEKDKKINFKFMRRILDKYKMWNGIGNILIVLVVVLSIFLVVRNSFYINNTYIARSKSVYENTINEIKTGFSEMKESGFSFGEIFALVDKWIKIEYIDVIFYNCILVLATVMFFYLFIGKIKPSLIISSFIWILFDIINYVVFKIRGTALAISDVFSLKTAISVTSGIEFKPTERFYVFIIVSILYFIVLLLIKFKKKDKTKKVLNISKRFLAIIVSIICVSIVLNIEGFKEENYWNLSEKYRLKGIEYAVLRQVLDLKISKPEGYSVAKAEEILSRYDESINEDENTNIIVVINESFADMNKVYELGIENNIPYYDSLYENVVKGKLYSSVYGGGTATAEWEFLTGNSAEMLPVNSIPLILYINNNKESFVSVAKEQGYQTVSIHPYKKSGYNRAISYPKLGFEKSLFIEDMLDYERTFTYYPSDKYTYSKLIEEYESRDKNKKFLGYVLTMQNHLPYTTSNDFYMPDGYVENNDEFDEYLSLVRDSDDALKELLEYFEKEEEKTIIVFFGDHQPNIEFEYNESSISNKWLANYEVPYMLWANFDIEEKEGEDISFNLFSTLLYDYSGLNSTQYIEFLKEFKENIPIYTVNGYKDKDGNTYEIDDKTSNYQKWIDEYKILEYYYMFDNNVE